MESAPTDNAIGNGNAIGIMYSGKLKMGLNDVGKMIEKQWHKISNDFVNNHIHGIIEIAGINEIPVGADSISALSVYAEIFAPISVKNSQISIKNGKKMDRAEMDRAEMNRAEMDRAEMNMAEMNRAEMDSAPTDGEL
jgi:hypothetical protein